MKEVVIGFPLWHEDIMEYARLCGFKLFPYVYNRNGKEIDFEHKMKYDGNSENDLGMVYSKNELGNIISKYEPYKSGHLFIEDQIKRDDPILIQLAKGEHLTPFLKVVEIPDDVKWYVTSTDRKSVV